MSGRANKNVRRLSTDSEGTEEGYAWAGLKGASRSQSGRAEKATGKKG